MGKCLAELTAKSTVAKVSLMADDLVHYLVSQVAVDLAVDWVVAMVMQRDHKLADQLVYNSVALMD